jgi:hypothetical protein
VPAGTHDDADPEPLTISEAVIVCGVDRKTLERRLRQGEFPNAFRAPRDPEGSSFQAVWRIPVSDLRAAGLEVDLAKLPPRKPPLDAELARVTAERDAWQQRALLAEALAEERSRALEDARQALHALKTAVERTVGTPTPVVAAIAPVVEEPEVESIVEQPRRRGNWLA